MSDRAEIDQKLLEIKRAIRERQPDVARQLLIEVLKADPENAEAWFVSSFLIKDPAAQIDAAQRALAINPDFSAAQNRLKELLSRQAGPTPLASVYEAERVEPPAAPPPKPAAPAPPPNVFNTGSDEATVISQRPTLNDSPFEPPVPIDSTQTGEPTGVMAPFDFDDAPTVSDNPFDDATNIIPQPTIPDETHASEKFPFDEPAAALASNEFDFLDEPPPPIVPPVTPAKPTVEEFSFDDLLDAPPDSPRAVADADKLIEEQPFESPSKAKRPQKGDHVALDKPYDPSIKQPHLPPTGTRGKAGGRKTKAQLAAKAAQKARQNSQDQTVTLILLTVLLIAVLAVAGAIVVRSRGGLEALFPPPTETSLPVIVSSSTALPPTTTAVPTLGAPTSVAGTSAPVIAPALTTVPTEPPATSAPVIVPTQAPPTQTLTPVPPTRTPTRSTPTIPPPPASATSAAGSAAPPTAVAQANASVSNAQATSTAQSIADADAPVIDGFRAGITEAKTLIRAVNAPALDTSNAGQIARLTRIAIPGLFSVIFHDGKPTLIFQTSGFADRPAATFAIASLLDDQPVMRVSMQTASALGSVLFSRDEKRMVSASSTTLTVIDPENARVLRTIEAQNSTAAMSADGKRAATVSNNVASASLWDLESGALERTVALDEMTADRGPNSLAFSPDGQSLAVGGCDGSIRVIDIASGKTKTIKSGSGTFDCFDVITYSPNGAYLLATDNNGIGRFRVADGGMIDLIYAGIDANPRPKVALSGDGRLVAAMNTDFLVLWNFETGAELARRPLDDVGRVDGLTFSADNHFVVTATRGSFNGLRWWGVPSGALADQATATVQAQAAGATSTAVALGSALQGTGQIVYARPVDGTQLGLFSIEPGVSGETMLTLLLRSADGPPFSFTPDGKRVAFITRSGSNAGVAVIDAAALPTQAPIIEPLSDRPLLSPDGQYVFFRQNDGQCGMARADGSPVPFGGEVACRLNAAVWSPDSHALAVEQLSSSPTESNSTTTNTQILLMQVSASGVSAPVTVGPDSPRALDPAFTPDGRLTYLLFDVAAKDYALFTDSSDGDGATLLAKIPGNATYHTHVWSLDGKRVALVEATEPEQIIVLDSDGSAVAQLPGDELYTQVDSLVWSPDSRFIAASRTTRDHAQARIFVYSADGSTAAPLADGSGALWLP